MTTQSEDMKSYLRKLKTSRLGRLFGNTNMRWFECLFKDKVFGYKDIITDNKLKSSLRFDEIIDFSNKLNLEDAKMCDWNYGFQLVTKDRVFILFCQNQETLENWVICFNTILKRGPKKLAVISAPNFGSLKPKQEKKSDEKIGKMVENRKNIEKRVEEKRVDNELRREENNHSTVFNAPENKAKTKNDKAIVLDDDELIFEKDENIEINKPNIREEYKAERPKHSKNIIPHLINTKKEIKTIAIKDEFDENIENIIIEADKSFDNVNIVKQNNDKYYKHSKKAVRSASVILNEKPNNSNNVLKNILNKEQEIKDKDVVVGKEFDDWNFYDKEGNIDKNEKIYNPATSTKEKKNEIAKLMSCGVFLGNENEEDNDKSIFGKSALKENSKLLSGKQKAFNQTPSIINENTIYNEKLDNVYSDFLNKEQDKAKKEVFIPKTILSSTVLYDNNRKTTFNIKPTQETKIDEKSKIESLFKIEGLAHPELKTRIPFEENKQDIGIEIEETDNFFDIKVHESKYNNTNSNLQKKKIQIKSLQKMDNDFDDLDYHNQKSAIKSHTLVIQEKKNANNSLLIVNTKEDSGKKKIANNNINKEMFDSNPELTNNIFPIGSQVNSTNTFNLVQQKKAKSNNMNSSFVEDLTDDWKD